MAAKRRPKTKPAKPPNENKAQSAMFLATAKKLEVDESGKAFERALDAIVLPLERTLVSLFTMPHAQADLKHLLQPFIALLQWRER